MIHDEVTTTPVPTILIIDDNREHLRMLGGILKEQGYRVRLAPDGVLGLNSARLSSPDIILLDIAMADMDGYEVCRRLKHDAQTTHIPVIFISALDDAPDKVKAFAAGGVDYITKPFQAEEVLARVTNHLALRDAQQELQQEIAERKQTEDVLRRVERALRALSQCNLSLLHASDETELLSTICQIIVEKGDYRLAWVGFAECDAAKTVRPIAWAGYEAGYLATIRITWDESERGRGPTGTAIRTGTPCIVTNMISSSQFAPWRIDAQERGYASSIALPLIHATETLGALNVYASEPDAFDAEEVNLLTQLANNLAYGISSLRSRAARDQAEAALRENQALFQAFLNYSPALVFVRDLQGRFVIANHAYGAMIGCPHEQIVGKMPHDVLPADIAERFRDHDHEIIRTGKPVMREEVVSLADGVRIYLANKFPVYDRDGTITAVGGISTDITERKQVEEKMRQRNKELAVINHITDAVNLYLSLPDIVQTLQELMVERLGMLAGAIYLYYEEDDVLSRQALWGEPPTAGAAYAQLPVGTAHSLRIVRDHIPLFIPLMTHTTPDTPNVSEQTPGDADGVAWSYLGVPILAQRKLQGVLELFTTPPAQLSDEQIAFFTSLGQHVGTAIQNARLFAEVQSARERLQTLSHRLVEVQEMERRTIARELHDEVGQILTGLNLSLEMVARLPVEQIYERIEHALGLVNELMQRVREMSMQLRPPMLDDLGLLPALVWHFERYTSQTGVNVIFKHTGVERRFRPELEITVYRMIQEALTNVARHAGVPQVVVRLWAFQDELGVQVEDEGCGFDVETIFASGSSSGLSGMRERVRLLGGDLQIDTQPGHGSCLVVELPLTPPSSQSPLLYHIEEHV